MAVQISGNDITVPRDGTFSRNVSIAGTLTYEDVTNVDSIGLVTARNGIEVGASPGVAASISVDGNMIVSGITTLGSDVKIGTGVTLSPDGNAFFTGVITATTFSGVDTDKISEGNTEAEVVDTGSDGHFKVTTEGTERIRVGPSGQIGIAGANYGTSGQVLSSQGSGSAVQWATPGLIYEGNLTSLPTDAGSVNVDVILDACKRIEIFIFSYSVNSSSGEFVLRLRTGSGTITSNYKGSGHYLSNTSYAGATANSDGFKSYGLGDSSSNYTGHIVVKNVHSNIWFCNGDFWNDASSTGYWMSGHVDAGAALAGVQLRNNSGSFDAGTYKIIQYNTI